MTTKKQDLAQVFTQIQAASESMEAVSKGILDAIKLAKATTLERFNRMVEDAYKVNGWSQKPGRRLPGDTLTSAPRAVTFYVSTIRAAYRLHLKVGTYDLMEKVREDIAAARKAVRDADKAKELPAVAPEVIGVQVQQENALTGALWHDALVVREHLDDEQRKLFDSQVRRLLAKYRKEASADLLAA